LWVDDFFISMIWVLLYFLVDGCFFCFYFFFCLLPFDLVVIIFVEGFDWGFEEAWSIAVWQGDLG